MSKAFHKDILRSIKKGWKRFLSIMIITTLGVGMMTGLYAACLDMYYSADYFFDEQNLFDIKILSTLGLTQEDVAVLSRVEGVEAAEGGYIETVHTDIDGARKSADMTVLSRGGINLPRLLAGALPAKTGEIAVTQKYIEDSGKSIGDTLTIKEDIKEKNSESGAKETSDNADPNADGKFDTDIGLDMETELANETEVPTFANTAYTITGIVLDPKDIRGNEDAGIVFRSTVTADYSFFITEADVSSDIFTVVYIVLSGTKGLNSYSDEYKDRVQTVIGSIESRIKIQREQARYDAVISESRAKIADAENTMNGKFAEADQKLADAWHDINKARQELADGEVTLTDEQKDADKKIAEAREKLENAKRELTQAEEKLSEGEKQLAESEAELLKNERELADGEQQLLSGERELADGKKALQESEQKLADGEKQLTEAEKQLADGEKQLALGEAELNANAQKLAEGKQRLADEQEKATVQLAAAERQLDAAQSQLDAARAQLEPGIAQLRSAFGDAWPANEWNALVNASAALAATGADDSAVAAGTASESAALAAVIEQMNAQAGQPDALPKDAAVQAALGMGKAIGGQQALDAQKSSFAQQKSAALQKLSETQAELDAGEKQIEESRNIIKSKEAESAAGKVKLDEERAKLETGKADLAEGWVEWKKGRAELDEKWSRWKDGKAKLTEGRAKWEDGKAGLSKGWAELEKGKIEAADGEAKLKQEEADAKTKLSDAWDEIADGKQELSDGESELIEKEREYAEKKEEARQKLADAYAELDDIDMTKWYVQDRTSLDSYFSLSSDLSSIEAVGRLFPVIFLLVAVLMSLTAMTRMVEEERGLIGTYKALGFRNADIYRKYIIFAFTACILGGVLGDVFGFVFMPRFIAVILQSLYSFPQYYLRFDVLYGLGGVALFMAAIIGATVLACRGELTQMPAALLRPKAPSSGSRVWLERIPLVWNRLKFLNKVTARNLFRYKKRLFMTIGGIMGCTALIVCGFAIKDSVMKLSPSQYDDIYKYDLMVVYKEKDNDNMLRYFTNDSGIDDYLILRIENIKLLNADGDSSPVQLMVIPDGSAMEDYICLEDPDGKPVHLDDGGVLITQNATRILDLKTGGAVLLQNLELDQGEAAISGIVRNYLGNNVYMTQKLYESLFGAYKPDGVLAHLSDACADQAAYAETLLDNDSVLSAVSTAALREDFKLDLLNSVVLLLIVMAGALAFAVLFTLSNTNISERVRELATIKVLGFYDKEVYQYVNKETLLLTAMGILLGFPAGYILSKFIIAALNMPSIHFAVYIKPVSYLFSAAITFCFAVIVNWITNRTLDRINMVEALKSVE